MFGKNPIRPPEKGDGTTLHVQEIFPTLQGEGPFVGHPAIFVRLGGCNLACHFCDTEFEQFEEMELGDVLARVAALAGATHRLVVITGGEPFRQEIRPLCEALLAANFTVQIETNGTLWRELPEAVNIICSPKVTAGKYHPIRPDLLARVSAFKFIISAHDPAYSDIAAVGQEVHGTTVYVQPMDEYDPTRNAKNQALALKLAMANGYRLSLQTHKMLGIA